MNEIKCYEEPERFSNKFIKHWILSKTNLENPVSIRLDMPMYFCQTTIPNTKIVNIEFGRYNKLLINICKKLNNSQDWKNSYKKSYIIEENEFNSDLSFDKLLYKTLNKIKEDFTKENIMAEML